MTDLFTSDLFITNTIDRPCISPPVYKPPPPPLYNPIKNRLRKYISPGLIVGGLRYSITLCVFQVNISCHYIGATKLYNILYWACCILSAWGAFDPPVEQHFKH
jgi:hypothetical protein